MHARAEKVPATAVSRRTYSLGLCRCQQVCRRRGRLVIFPVLHPSHGLPARDGRRRNRGHHPKKLLQRHAPGAVHGREQRGHQGGGEGKSVCVCERPRPSHTPCDEVVHSAAQGDDGHIVWANRAALLRLSARLGEGGGRNRDWVRLEAPVCHASLQHPIQLRRTTGWAAVDCCGLARLRGRRRAGAGPAVTPRGAGELRSRDPESQPRRPAPRRRHTHGARGASASSIPGGLSCGPSNGPMAAFLPKELHCFTWPRHARLAVPNASRERCAGC